MLKLQIKLVPIAKMYFLNVLFPFCGHDNNPSFIIHLYAGKQTKLLRDALLQVSLLPLTCPLATCPGIHCAFMYPVLLISVKTVISPLWVIIENKHIWLIGSGKWQGLGL